MLVLKYFVMIAGFGLFGSAGALVGYDIFLSAQLRKEESYKGLRFRISVPRRTNKI